MMAQVGRLEQH